MFRYIRKHWTALCNFCDDGLAEVDNEHGALLYRLIGTYQVKGIDPEAYLRHILNVLPEWPYNRVDDLQAWNVVLTNK